MHDHLTAIAAPCVETRVINCVTNLQVIDPSHPQPMDLPQATARSDSSYLAQDYREQPDEDQASSSDDNMDDQVSELDAEEAISDDEDGGPSTWLDDPPKGERANQCLIDSSCRHRFAKQVPYALQSRPYMHDCRPLVCRLS